jgi:hypothetical protein
MKKVIIILTGLGLLLLVGCGPAEPELATSVEDVSGTWTPADPGESGYFTIHSDGSLSCGPTLSVAREFSVCDASVWFEGTEMHLVDQNDCNAAEGVYEIQLLENGNIKHLLVEDDEACSRIDFLAGEDREGVEMEPVIQ